MFLWIDINKELNIKQLKDKSFTILECTDLNNFKLIPKDIVQSMHNSLSIIQDKSLNLMPKMFNPSSINNLSLINSPLCNNLLFNNKWCNNQLFNNKWFNNQFSSNKWCNSLLDNHLLDNNLSSNNLSDSLCINNIIHLKE